MEPVERIFRKLNQNTHGANLVTYTLRAKNLHFDDICTLIEAYVDKFELNTSVIQF